MGAERGKGRVIYCIAFLLVGVVLLLILNSFLGTTIVSDKVDYKRYEVRSLFCTFERVQFDVEDVISNLSGVEATLINITRGNDFFSFYIFGVSKTDFVDVGLLHWNDGQLLAFSSERRLEDDMNYVVDHGTIYYLSVWGTSNSETRIVKIEKIHLRNWFDEFVSESRSEILILIGLAFVLTCCLFCLPFIEYHINSEIERITKKERKRQQPIEN